LKTRVPARRLARSNPRPLALLFLRLGGRFNGFSCGPRAGLEARSLARPRTVPCKAHGPLIEASGRSVPRPILDIPRPKQGSSYGPVHVWASRKGFNRYGLMGSHAAAQRTIPHHPQPRRPWLTTRLRSAPRRCRARPDAKRRARAELHACGAR